MEKLIITAGFIGGVLYALRRLDAAKQTLKRGFDESERGAVAVLVAIIVPVILIGVLALVVDLGGQVAARRSMVTASDAAALAAAQACGLPGTASGAEAAADELAAANVSDVGIITGLQGGIVKVTGCGGPIGAVQVTYRATVARSFAGALGVGPGTVVTTATAAWETTTPATEPVVGNGDSNGKPQGNTQTDPQPTGVDCTHPGAYDTILGGGNPFIDTIHAGGPTPGSNPNHCPEPVTTVRLVS